MNGASRAFAPIKSFNAAFGKTCPTEPTNGTYQPGAGSLNDSLTVFGSTASTLAIWLYRAYVVAPVSLVVMNFQVKTTSSAVNGVPVRPLDVFLQLVDDRLAVGAQSAVLNCWHLCRQNRHELAIIVESHQRLIHHPAGEVVFRAVGQIPVHNLRSLPEQHLQGAPRPRRRRPAAGALVAAAAGADVAALAGADVGAADGAVVDAAAGAVVAAGADAAVGAAEGAVVGAAAGAVVGAAGGAAVGVAGWVASSLERRRERPRR